jgi:predicted phosphoadenosine phosphosulfate sulfurtransferase
MKTYLAVDVRTAAEGRVSKLLARFAHVCVSFSGGKDSTALLHLAATAAAAQGRTVDVLFVDWEAQYTATIEHCAEMLTTGRPGIGRVFWVALPISTSNETSFHEPMWTAWDEAKREVWVRPRPEFDCVIGDPAAFPFYRYGMLFEEFVPAFNEWYAAAHGPTAYLIGIRADESLNRFRAVKKQGHKGVRKRYADADGEITWSTQVTADSFNFYPLYDWRVEDVWTYLGDEGAPYNHIYDAMHLAGMSVHEMRICEPYSLEARRHLDKFHYLEPETWARVVERVAGANFGAKAGRSELFAFGRIEKPAGMTWKEYAALLLDSLPPDLQAHYRRRIDVFVGWFQKHLGWDDLKEESDPKLEAKKLGGSWRMVCRTLLRNDYFCSHLSFSVNKQEYEKAQALREKYRDL